MMAKRPALDAPDRSYHRNTNDPLDGHKTMLASNVRTYLGVVKANLAQQGISAADDTAASLLLEVAAEFLRSEGRDETIVHLKEILKDIEDDHLRTRSY